MTVTMLKPLVSCRARPMMVPNNAVRADPGKVKLGRCGGRTSFWGPFLQAATHTDALGSGEGADGRQSPWPLSRATSGFASIQGAWWCLPLALQQTPGG
jgi:hypothetical protein